MNPTREHWNTKTLENIIFESKFMNKELLYPERVREERKMYEAHGIRFISNLLDKEFLLIYAFVTKKESCYNKSTSLD